MEKNNNVTFDELNGITGIFGKNFSGKSSIIDAVLWTLFNTTSKNERKNLNVINQNKEYTDANIRKHFGTLDDFMVSSLASQHGALSFIDEGSTRRKEIIAKFLDLEIFDKKFRMAKENSIDLKGALKRLEDKNYDEEIETAKIEYNEVHENLQEHEKTCATLELAFKELSDACGDIQAKIDSIPAEIIDIVDIKKQINQKENQTISINLKINEDKTKLDFNQELYEKVISYLDNFELDTCNKAIEQIHGKEKEIERLEELLLSCESDYDNVLNKQKLLSNIPCGTQYPGCKFIRDAHVAVARKPELEIEKQEATEHISQVSEDLAALKPDEVNKKLEKYREIEQSKHDISAKIADLNLEIARNKNTIQLTESELEKLKIKRDEYEENKEAIENLEQLVVQLNKCQYKIQQTESRINACNSETLELYKEVGSLEQKVVTIEQQKQEYIELQREYTAYDLLMQCMHANGIAYDVIKKKIPVINDEIAKVLANVVDFEVFFETNGNKFDIFIKHSKHAERPIEMASGAEKTMAAMAIRLALLSVSSLPKSDLFILDEPGTALDEENMEGFIRILELIKMYFKNVLLISHLDSLKDCVDMQIVIDKKKGYARVNQ
jgi:DNA repair exonuclease SbcCD ATPase subunit